MTTENRRRHDPLARLAVYALFDTALFAGAPTAAAPWVLVPLILLQFVGLARYFAYVRMLHGDPRVPIPPTLRFAIMKRDHYRCRICGRTAARGARLEVDHKRAVVRGGTNDPSNLWTLCATCNSGKSDSRL